MEYNTWRKRISNRTDMAARITHLTKGDNDEQAFENLWKILCDKRLIGSGRNGYIVGNESAVCFQDMPLVSIAENLLFEDELDNCIRYSWFGLRFNKVRMHRTGARPVIYGKTEELKSILPTTEYWRIVNLDLDEDNLVDWSHEREWRIKGDYQFNYNDIEILVKNDEFYKKLIKKCLEENRTDILLECNGIQVLNSIIF